MKFHWTLSVGVLLSAAVAFGVRSNLINKEKARQNDRHITLAVDWEDVDAFQLDLKSLAPVHFIVMPTTALRENIKRVREAGYGVLWRQGDDAPAAGWSDQFQSGEALFIATDHALEHPALIRQIPDIVSSHNGYLVLMEFISVKFLPLVASKVSASLIKGHVLSTREMIPARPITWKKRLLRAVEERWVRLLLIRFAPTWSPDENRNFLQKMAGELQIRGFDLGKPEPFHGWLAPPVSGRRPEIALLLAVLSPVLLLIGATKSRGSPFLIFLVACTMSVFAGIAVQGLTATPASVVGLSLMRGVKIQLIVPLILAIPVLFRVRDLKQKWNSAIQWKHAIILFGGVGLVAVIFLMRSGNFPIIPVFDAERGFRDTLDHLLIARPRFKECFFGHPLFILGLTLKGGKNLPDNLAQWLLWGGLIGQISIINTFTHIHTPLEMSLIRTLNGMWIGAVVAAGGQLLVHYTNRS